QDLSDERRAANVWNDEPHTSLRLVVDGPIALVTKDNKTYGGRRRPFKNRVHRIHQPLRPAPLLIEARLQEFSIWHDVGSSYRCLDLGEKISGCRGLKPCVLIDV